MRPAHFIALLAVHVAVASATFWAVRLEPASAPLVANTAAGNSLPRPNQPRHAAPERAPWEQAFDAGNGYRRCDALLPFLPELGEADLLAVLTRLAAMAGSGQEDCVELAAQLLALRNADKAVEFAVGCQDAALRGRVLRAIFAVLGATDPERAGALRGTLQGADQANAEYASRQVGPQDLIDQIERGAERSAMLNSAFESLTRETGAQTALARAAALTEPRLRNRAHDGIARAWAATDPTAALNWAVTHRSAPGEFSVFLSALESAAKAHPAVTAAWLDAQPPSLDRSNSMGRLAGFWAAEDFPSALAWAQRLREVQDQELVIRALLPEWMREDPAAGMAQAMRLSERGRFSGGLVTLALEAWTAADSGAALAWLHAQPEGRQRARALEGFSESRLAAGESPRALLDRFGQLRLGSRDASAVIPALQQLAVSDLPGAMAWAMEQSNLALRRSLFASLLEVQARTDLSGSVRSVDEWFRRPLAAGTPTWSIELERAVSGLAKSWAATEPEAAANWLAGLPEASEQEHLAAELAEAWAARDPAAALRWILGSSLPPGGAIAGIFEQATTQNPATAIALLGTLQDVHQRRLAGLTIERIWRRTDRAAAAAWVARDRPDLAMPEGYTVSLDD